MSELKPCPFCGFDNIMSWSKKSKRSGGVEWTCRCPMCNAYGSRHSTEQGAIDAWNTRNNWISVSERLPDDDIPEPPTEGE